MVIDVVLMYIPATNNCLFVTAAVKVCEYGLALTDGSNPATVIAITDRLPLLKIWIKLKHCLQSHVGKTLGTTDEVFCCSLFSEIVSVVHSLPCVTVRCK